MLSTNRWQQRQMGDGRLPQGKRAFYLRFTATMEHVRYILLLLFNLTVCINILENYLTSCLRAIDWIVGPQSVLTDVSLEILRGAPLTLASGRCIIQTGRGKWCLYFHQSSMDIFLFGYCNQSDIVVSIQMFVFFLHFIWRQHETPFISKWLDLNSCHQRFYYI